MKWHAEALTRGCLKTARAVEPLPWLQDFYLAGGTALALRYGHRVSVDLDFFSNRNDLDFSGRERVIKGIRAIGAVIEEQKDGTVHARHGNTHVSFFRYRYPLLRPLARWDKLRVAHPIDIALMKVGAIIGRGSKKDFVDLYVLLKEELSLPQLLRLADKKFSTGQEWALQASRALVYFADADREPTLKMRAPILWPDVKRFFETEVRRLADSLFRRR